MTPLRDKTAIVGIGQTRLAKHLEESETELACQAVLAALDDAGIAPDAVDALASFTLETTSEFELASTLGLGEIKFFSQVPYGGGAACGAVGQVALAVATGIANVGVAWRSRKRGARAARNWSQVNARIDDHWKYTRPLGLVRPVDEVGLLTRRYMHEYGASRDHLANVALACRKHANRNPTAFMYEKPLTREDYMKARWISEPLCLFDNCLESDGALAVVVTRADRARDCKQPPAYIHAFSQGLSRQHHVMIDFFSPDPLHGCSWTVAENLWRQSDFKPADVKVAQLYDAFSPLILLSLEAYGFCARGEAPAFTENGALELGGRLPINTSGGSLSEAYVHGMNLVTEAVKQIRGTSTAQVDNADVSLVTSAAAVPTGALLLRR
jgi:acetyl-CoA acetyltransferase